MSKKEKYKQRADGRYYARVSTGKCDDSGKIIMKYVYGKTSREVEKKVNEIKYEIEHGMYAHDKGITLGTYAQKWIEVAKATKSAKTRDMYKNIINNHMDLIQHKKLKDITRSDIQLQINAVLDKPRTCQLIKITLKQILDCAIDDGLITKNVCNKLELPRRVVNTKRPLTETEKIAIKRADFTAKERVLVMLAYGTGMRPSELYALTRNDFNFVTNEVTVSKSLVYSGTETIVSYPKTNSGIRTIQLPSTIASIVKDYIEHNDSLITSSHKH